MDLIFGFGVTLIEWKMNETRVFAVDPGKRSGWAVAVVGPSGIRRWSASDVGPGGDGVSERWRSGRRGEVGQVDALVAMIDTFRPDVLVVEDFVLRVARASPARSLLSPVRVTSMLEWRFAGELRIVKFSAADAKSVITDRRLKSLGFWVSGSNHARDAVRHMLLFVRKQKNRRLEI